jgi:acetyltransferase-like isoleucine patch superfamily enzyme
MGNHVQITDGVRFFTHGGGWFFREKHPNFDTFGKIIIGNNVYIGNSALIMPGVSIGNNVIIGAGSIVTKSITDGMVVAGNPAKVIGNFESLEIKIFPYNLDCKAMNLKEKKEFLLSLKDDRFLKK